jgi:murein DD-endopeptidase MepM/ murein hydrolase activator NlpD
MESNFGWFEIIVGVVGGAFLYFYKLKSDAKASNNEPAEDFSRLAPILQPMRLRVDAKGDGHFGASRTGHAHAGADFLCKKGQIVLAPMSGLIVRQGVAYSNDATYKVVVLSNPNGYEVKMMYCTTDKVGQQVKRGEPIAICQAIAEKYGAPMQNHIHLEIRKNGQLLNPMDCMDCELV